MQCIPLVDRTTHCPEPMTERRWRTSCEGILADRRAELVLPSTGDGVHYGCKFCWRLVQTNGFLRQMEKLRTIHCRLDVPKHLIS